MRNAVHGEAIGQAGIARTAVENFALLHIPGNVSMEIADLCENGRVRTQASPAGQKRSKDGVNLVKKRHSAHT